jgi:hydrogenase expression/formation protein HypC
MCLAIPSKIVTIENDSAIVDVGGVRREISLFLLDNVKIGDYVIVHAGFAISTLDETTAVETLQELRTIVSNPS